MANKPPIPPDETQTEAVSKPVRAPKTTNRTKSRAQHRAPSRPAAMPQAQARGGSTATGQQQGRQIRALSMCWGAIEQLPVNERSFVLETLQNKFGHTGQGGAAQGGPPPAQESAWHAQV